MSKIVFFLKNELIPDIDYTNVCISNPGVGGTEYLFVLTAYMLSKRSDFEIVLYAQKSSVFPEGLNVEYTDSIGTGIQKAAKDNVDVFICREDPLWIKYGFFANIPSNIKVVLWAHNFIETKRLDYYYKTKGIYSLVCVGREQLDMYIDHRIYGKMDYIYNANAFPNQDVVESDTINVADRNNIVTYIGALQPYKGFHILAKAWPDILKEVPDAELYVIGSGQVYDNSTKMGRYGFSSEEYERVFMPSLTDAQGRILPSVHFMGRMGEEKNEIIKKTKVGIPNPSGKTETFGLGAVEFQGFGCCVVTKKCPGYVDTVLNHENLYCSNKDVAKFVIRNLKNPLFNYSASYPILYDRFHYDSVTKEWIEYLRAVLDGKYRIHDLQHNIPNIFWNAKWLRIVNCKVTALFNYLLPPVKRYSEYRFVKKITWHIEHFMNR